MGFDLNNGFLYMQNTDGDLVPLGENVSGVAEVEISANEVAPISYNLYSDASLSFEMKYEYLDLLKSFCDNSMPPTGNFTMEYKRPIMVQARWHKKARVRKKWLKRFGMKPDTVKVCVDANALEYHPGHILDEQYDDSGIWATYNSFEFETNKQEYILRPDQKRRGIKIEW